MGRTLPVAEFQGSWAGWNHETRDARRRAASRAVHYRVVHIRKGWSSWGEQGLTSPWALTARTYTSLNITVIVLLISFTAQRIFG